MKPRHTTLVELITRRTEGRPATDDEIQKQLVYFKGFTEVKRRKKALAAAQVPEEAQRAAKEAADAAARTVGGERLQV